MDITLEKSEEQAAILRQMQAYSLMLDSEYLEQCYNEMKSAHSWRDSAMILSPNPVATMDKQELEAIKLKQLKCYLDLANNTKALIESEKAFAEKKAGHRKLEELFGL